VIEDEDEDCDDVEGLRASEILAATGLEFSGEISWTDLETGEEASRSAIEVAVTIEAGGTITCVPFRHLPGSAPEYAHLSYDAVTLSMETDDGVLNETGPAVAWLAETASPGVFELNVVRALPATAAVGTFEVSELLSDAYETLVLVYAPSDAMPLGHVSAASESAADVEDRGLVAAGVPHGYFPALVE